MAAFSYTSGIQFVPRVRVVQQFGDGSAVVTVRDVRMSVGARGQVFSMSDWSRAAELVEAGALVADTHKGNGTEGHDTYRLADWQ